MEHTENYQLSLWEQDDFILMDDFNDNHAKLDAALAGKADNAAVSALTTRVGNLETGKADAAAALTMDNLPFVIGSYTGDGKDRMNDGGHLVDIGFRPTLVFITQTVNSSQSSTVPGKMFMDDGTLNPLVFTLEETGFMVGPSTNVNPRYPELNKNGTKYLYLAFK